MEKLRFMKVEIWSPLRILAVVLFAAGCLIYGPTVQAHNSTAKGDVKVTNRDDEKICVWACNGNDKDCLVAHNSAELDENEYATLKCHKKGKGRCRIIIDDKGAGSCGVTDVELVYYEVHTWVDDGSECEYEADGDLTCE